MVLRAILGPQLVASIAGYRTRDCVAGWAQGRSHPCESGELRLRIALELILLMVEEEGIEAARCWISRREPALEGRSPLAVLGEEPPARARRILVRAARASLRGGGLRSTRFPRPAAGRLGPAHRPTW